MRASPILLHTLPWQALGALAALGAGCTRPLMTLVFGSLANEFNGRQNPAGWQGQINQEVLFLVYIFLAQWALTLICGLCFSIAAIRISIGLRTAYFRSALSRQAEGSPNGQTAVDFSTNTENIEDALAEKLGIVIEALSTIIVSWVIALTRSWRLTLVLSVATVILLGSNFGTAAIDARIEGRLQTIEAQADTLAEECFAGILAVISTSAQGKLRAKFQTFSRAARTQRIRKSPILAAQYSISYFMVLASYAMSFWYGARFLSENNVNNVGTILIVILNINQGTNAMRRILPVYSVLAKATASFKSVQKVIHEERVIDPFSPTGIVPQSSRGDLEFREVDFAYPLRPDKPVLKNLNLIFEAGQITALVGPSGCGKSTIAALIGRWYDPEQGSITFDGYALRDLNVQAYRSAVRFVPQDTVLFSDSIYANVANGLHGTCLQGAPDSQKQTLVHQSCLAANAYEFIQELPQKFETILGDSGNFLSGGQKQRLAITRAIVSSPKILVLDEATTALDAQSEAAVEASLQEVSRGKTTILVTHKLSMARRAHKIYVLDQGQVVQVGGHDDLVNSEGVYKRLYEQQHAANLTMSNQSQREAQQSDYSSSNQEKRPDRDSIECIEPDEQRFGIERGISWPKIVLALLTDNRRIGTVLTASLVSGVVGALVYPGQAIAFGESITAFQLVGTDLRAQSDFWSLMWFNIAIGAFVVYMAVGTLTSITEALTLHNYRNTYFDSMLHQPVGYYFTSSRSPGALTVLLSSHPSQMQAAVADLITLVITIVNIGSSGILTLILAWKLALVVIFGSLPVVVLAGVLRLKAQGKGKRSLSNSLSGSANFAAEAVNASRTVTSLTMEVAVCEKLNATMRKSLPAFYKSIAITMPLFAFSQAGNMLGMVLAFWYAGDLLVNGEIGALQIWIIFLAIVSGGEAAPDFFASSNRFHQASTALNSIKTLRAASQSYRASLQANEKTADIGRVTSLDLKHVCFRYHGCRNTDILRDLDLALTTGKRYAIVGPSGSGKSTLLMLLANFYQPHHGFLATNGVRTSQIAEDAYRRQVALVSQDTLLFSGTLAENILLGVTPKDMNRELLEWAAKQASIHDFILSLPNGYETECGRRGTSFSGGQRQRIALARALAQRPSLLILDEPTSALDVASELAILKTLRDTAADRITVTVTHRLSTAQDADQIMVLVAGAIVATGTHQGLMAERGVYWAMFQQQSVEHFLLPPLRRECFK